jgi:hypothetical protein
VATWGKREVSRAQWMIYVRVNIIAIRGGPIHQYMSLVWQLVFQVMLYVTLHVTISTRSNVVCHNLKASKVCHSLNSEVIFVSLCM